MPGLDFAGRVVLVTGVGRAGQIGHAVAGAFGRAGAKLVVCDRNAVGVSERAREFVALGMDARPVAGDLTEPDAAALAVESALKHFGRLDVLVNVAGGLAASGPIERADVAAFDREISSNVKTAFLMCRAAVPALAATRGAIVNFASIAYYRPQRHLAIYGAAKAAVAGLTQSLAVELEDRGIRVNAVAPAAVRTADNLAAMGEAAERWVAIERITDAVLFLASDAAGGITGHVLPIAGGGA
ncbi:MAG TPA: SDR family NAD(P)-dependent oxidoreductase [Gemmatimonadales bacterium]|nr:SDR family NAD(P)-dependent oxidoreductase [Gemmatimonadales bacterium]